MNKRLPACIPQYFDSPVSLERVEYKACSGSYKATEYLRSLLEFTAIAVLGGDPFTDLPSGEMEDRLSAKYIACCESPLTESDPISMAMTWAWPPTAGGIIVFDDRELMKAIEALCLLLRSVEPATMIHRLAEKYIKEEWDDREFIEIGAAMKCLGVSREIVENATDVGSTTNHRAILRGYDRVRS